MTIKYILRCTGLVSIAIVHISSHTTQADIKEIITYKEVDNISVLKFMKLKHKEILKEYLV